MYTVASYIARCVIILYLYWLYLSPTRRHNSVRNTTSVIKVWCGDTAIACLNEPRPLALMHADSIREQLKKLLRRFNVRMISSEGTLQSLMMAECHWSVSCE